MEKNANRQVLIIGGGIVGMSCALSLANAGFKPRVVTRAVMRGTASWGNAGHIAVEQVEPLASMASIRSVPSRLFCRGGAIGLPPSQIKTWLPFSLRLLAAATPSRFRKGRSALASALGNALPAWGRLVASLGRDDLLKRSGHLLVWESKAGVRKGLAHWNAADTGTAEFHELGGEGIAVIEQLVQRQLAGGLRFAGTAQISDHELLADALINGLLARGGEILQEDVECLQDGPGGRVEARLKDGQTLAADTIVLTSGVESASLLRHLGIRVPLIAERGYHIQAATSSWPDDLPPVVFEERSLIVTRFADALRVASFVEFSEPDAPADPRKWRRLMAHAQALNLPIGSDAKPWMGSRPTLPDYLPAIGRSNRFPNLVYAFGHQHLGLTLGPLTGEIITALMLREAPVIELAPFNLTRFSDI